MLLWRCLSRVVREAYSTKRVTGASRAFSTPTKVRTARRGAGAWLERRQAHPGQ